MRDYRDVSSLVNLVSMLRSETRGAILLIDHEPEGRFYDSLVHQDARIIPSPSMAIEILYSATQRGIAGIAAAVRRTRAASELASCQFTPSTGDICSLLICSSNFERAVTNATGRTWYTSCHREIGSLAVRCIALALALENIASMTVPSPQIEKLLTFIDWQRLTLSRDTILEIASLPSFEKILCEFNENHKKPIKELLLSCNGEWAIEIITAAIERYHPHGLKPNSLISSIELLKMLELSYKFEDIESDPFFWKMRKWERSNPKYALLHKWRKLDPFDIVLDQRYWEADLKFLLSSDELDTELSLIKLDLDNFKSVNTKLGHTGGDEAIRIASRTILSIMSESGELYRRGGDEFIIIAPGLEGAKAKSLAEKIRIEIESVFLEWGKGKKLDSHPTASIGVVYTQHQTNFEDLIQTIDRAQQRAKDEGKNIVIYEEMSNIHKTGNIKLC